MPSIADGVDAIKREIETSGTDEDKDNLDYILNRPAGSSVNTFQHTGGLKRDCDDGNGRPEEGNVLPTRQRHDGTGKLFKDFVDEARRLASAKLVNADRFISPPLSKVPLRMSSPTRLVFTFASRAYSCYMIYTAVTSYIIVVT